MASKFIDNLAKLVDMLAARWGDEKEYEDFNDYIARAKKEFEGQTEYSFESLTKKPFKLICNGPKGKIEILVKGNKILVQNKNPRDIPWI